MIPALVVVSFAATFSRLSDASNLGLLVLAVAVPVVGAYVDQSHVQMQLEQSSGWNCGCATLALTFGFACLCSSRRLRAALIAVSCSCFSTINFIGGLVSPERR